MKLGKVNGKITASQSKGLSPSFSILSLSATGRCTLQRKELFLLPFPLDLYSTFMRVVTGIMSAKHAL